jgi:hypothetical protein
MRLPRRYAPRNSSFLLSFAINRVGNMPVFLLGETARDEASRQELEENQGMGIKGVPFGNSVVGKEDCSDEPNEDSGGSLPRPD